MNEQKKAKSGRPAAGASVGAGYQTRREITLDDRAADTLKSFGGGNLSAGVRKAAALIESLQCNINGK